MTDEGFKALASLIPNIKQPIVWTLNSSKKWTKALKLFSGLPISLKRGVNYGAKVSIPLAVVGGVVGFSAGCVKDEWDKCKNNK